MLKNDFLPPGIPLMTDYALIRALVEYRQAHHILTYSVSAGSRKIMAQLEDAIETVERELSARGLESGVAEKDIAMGRKEPGISPVQSSRS